MAVSRVFLCCLVAASALQKKDDLPLLPDEQAKPVSSKLLQFTSKILTEYVNAEQIFGNTMDDYQSVMPLTQNLESVAMDGELQGTKAVKMALGAYDELIERYPDAAERIQKTLATDKRNLPKFQEIQKQIEALPSEQKGSSFLEATSLFDDKTPRCESKVRGKQVSLPLADLPCKLWNLIA
eukprot:gnl/MRDRNA2_/MRDRNA2_34672_c0_seq2.p1 gnl/MRDRNA2_/MRDRNA2_34672_c0~~gnl/MRDRNA2_/MRDRNA2_34672_c0_seq2.p1  ORF type:complete len:210 (+),score=38.64 gnl/MRDRNA2_/MRDRNA2_34672_c0_seq2:87-632(+)